jgi:hypothetical protein
MIALGAVLTTAVLTLGSATSASALSYTNDGKSPESTGCANDAVTKRSAVAANSSNGTTIELRWSPSCRTAWARVTKAHGPIAYSWAGWGAKIVRNNDGKTFTCSVPSGGSSCYTAMVYDLDPLTSYAEAHGDDTCDCGYISIRTANY